MSRSKWGRYHSKYHSKYGRLINHSNKHPNVKAAPMDLYGDKRPILVFEAIRDIEEDEELLYDYNKEGQMRKPMVTQGKRYAGERS